MMFEKFVPVAKNAFFLFLEWAIFLVIGGFLFLGANLLISLLGIDVADYYAEDDSSINPFKGILIGYLPLLVISIVVVYLVHIVIFKRDRRLLGFEPKALFNQFGKGGVLAVGMLGIGFVFLILLDQLEIEGFIWKPGLFFGFMMFFLVQSAVEEIIGRSYLIPAIESRFNTITALLTSSVIFSLVHGSNANISYLGLTNIFLAGLVMGLLFIRYRSFWAPLGFHAVWNFFQGSFLGYEVSGIEVYSLIDSKETGLDWLSGGPFGFEGSILATIGLTAASVIIWKKYLKQRRVFE